jgi:phosphohistidine phosphatase
MEIYILRHGIAVERGSSKYKNDSERPLTKEGEEKTRQIAKGMLALDLEFDLILSSPFTRAEQTAHIVADEFGLEVNFTDALTPAGNVLDLIAELNDEKPHRVLLVGHEPDLSHLISLLATGNTEALIELKKGGLCKLTADRLSFGRCATLNWLLTPKQLRSMS